MRRTLKLPLGKVHFTILEMIPETDNGKNGTRNSRYIDFVDCIIQNIISGLYSFEYILSFLDINIPINERDIAISRIYMSISTFLSAYHESIRDREVFINNITPYGDVWITY